MLALSASAPRGVKIAEKSPKKVNIIEHVLVPKFTKLTAEEANAVLEQYNISPLQLPTILAKDLMCKAVAANVGDILKIERVTPVGNKSVYFRRVIA